jgi:hypothetical protein
MRFHSCVAHYYNTGFEIAIFGSEISSGAFNFIGLIRGIGLAR